MVTMSTRDRRRLLWAVNVALAVALVASVLALAVVPLDVGAVEPRPGQQHENDDPMHRPKTGPLSEYAVIYQRDLRKPLFDPKPVVAVKTQPPKPKLTVSLVGTALEPGFTYGLFRNKSGETKLVSIGEKIDGAEVTAVNEGSATVKFHGELITLKVEKKGSSR